jgi:MoxR-like ATPase
MNRRPQRAQAEGPKRPNRRGAPEAPRRVSSTLDPDPDASFSGRIGKPTRKQIGRNRVTNAEVHTGPHEHVDAMRAGLGSVIRGKPEAIELLLTGVLAGGHVLLEDVPGVGKTTLAKALARCFAADFSRIQFTPDLLPADILGCQVLDTRNHGFAFRAGPIFANVLLADEINRASPRTQSALLEAMNEQQVTVDGTSHALPAPFCVLATQNPADSHGTFPLPEAQLDRFHLCFGLGYPRPEDELDLLFDRYEGDPLEALQPVTDVHGLAAIQKQVRSVQVKTDVARYMLAVIDRTRSHPQLDLGISPRGSLAWFHCAQARAFLLGRDYASPDDFQQLAVPVLAHRLQLGGDARFSGATASALVREILADIRPPL